MNPRRIKAILADPDFAAFHAEHARKLTKKVMSQAPTPEERAATLAEYHALERLIASMRSVAQSIKEDD